MSPHERWAWLAVGTIVLGAATCALPSYDFHEGGAAGDGTGASGGSGGVGGAGGVSAGGAAQGGAAVCPPPVEDYDFEGCGGADLQFDEANCGACGRSCLDGQCTEGQCEILPFGADVQSVLDFMPLDDQQIFIAIDNAAGAVWQMGQSTFVSRGDAIRPTGLAMHEGALYFSDRRDTGLGGGGAGPSPGGVYAFDGELAPSQLGTKSGTYGLHVDDEGIYFVETWWGGVSVWLFSEPEQRTLYDSGTVQVLGVDSIKGVITAGKNYAYFAIQVAHGGNDPGVYRVVKEGSATMQLGVQGLYSPPNRTITDLFVVDDYLYIAEEVRDGGGLCVDGAVHRAPIIADGIGPLEVLEASAQCPHGFAADEHFVYWLHRAAPNTGSVMRYSRFCDLPVEPLRSGLDEPQFLRVTDGAMFLGEWAGNGKTRLSRSTKTRDPE